MATAGNTQSFVGRFLLYTINKLSTVGSCYTNGCPCMFHFTQHGIMPRNIPNQSGLYSRSSSHAVSSYNEEYYVDGNLFYLVE